MKETKYLIRVEVRDGNGKIMKDGRGVKVPCIQFEHTLNEYQDIEDLLESTYHDFRTILSDEKSVNVEAYVHNGIAGTWMNIASYYGSEQRFVKH